MGVAGGGEYAYSAVFTDEAVSDWEGSLAFCDVAEGVCC